MERVNFSSGSPFEPLRGFSRAVKVGNSLYISGTTALTLSGEIGGGTEAYDQTRYILEKIKQVTQQAGFQVSDIVRTRLFVTNIGKWDDYARAHREVFESVRPASSIVQVARLVDPRLLVEIEAEAVNGVTNHREYSSTERKIN